MSTSTPLQPKKILSQMLELRSLAMRESWELAYDQETDQLYYAPEKLPKGVRLFNFGSEFALYLDDASNVKGLFIEYFSTNFTEHEKEFKKIVKLLNDETDGYKTSRDKESEDVRLAEDALSGEAFKSVYAFFEKLEKSESKEDNKKGR